MKDYGIDLQNRRTEKRRARIKDAATIVLIVATIVITWALIR